jgi:hypothetical protein
MFTSVERSVCNNNFAIRLSSITLIADVLSAGNEMLPGFEGRSIPDKLTIGSERFK